MSRPRRDPPEIAFGQAVGDGHLNSERTRHARDKFQAGRLHGTDNCLVSRSLCTISPLSSRLAFPPAASARYLKRRYSRAVAHFRYPP